MTTKEMIIELELAKIDLISKVEAFNKKAAILGIEPIPYGGNSSTTSTDVKTVDGKVFNHYDGALKYLEGLGWKKVGSYELTLGTDVASINLHEGGWIIKVQ